MIPAPPPELLAASSAVETGLFSLGGVLIGGFLAAGLTALHDWRARRREARKARRLALADLGQAQQALVAVRTNLSGERDWPVGGDADHQEDRRWPVGWERVQWTETWTANRGALADALDDEAFSAVAPTFGLLGQLQNSLAAGQHTFVPDDPGFIERVEQHVKTARELLQ